MLESTFRRVCGSCEWFKYKKKDLKVLLTYLSLLRQLFPVSGIRRAVALLHLSRSRAVSSVMLRTLMSSFTLSIQLFLGLPLGLLPSTIQSLIVANTSPSSLLFT